MDTLKISGVRQYMGKVSGHILSVILNQRCVCLINYMSE